MANPLGLPRGEIDANDFHGYSSELNSQAADLFTDGEAHCHVELRQYAPKASDELGPLVQRAGNHGFSVNSRHNHGAETDEDMRMSKPLSISTARSLQSALEATVPEGSTRIFTIHRANSWSRMRITHGMFRALGEGLNVTPRILDLIRGMRSKITPGDEHFMSCYYDLHETPNTQHRGGRRSEIGYEMCYNLRHFEKHGRDLKDPWTCRQAVIHQRHLMAAHSDWVIIQPSIRWQASLDDVCIGRTTHPLALHIRSISSAIANNWEYLEYLSSQLLSLDQRAAFPQPLDKFDFDFTLNQKVHSIRKRLHHVKTILEGTLRTVSAFTSLAAAIRKAGWVSRTAHDAFLRELGHITRDLKAYQSTTEELLSLSGDIKSTINSVLDLRNQEIFNGNSAQLHRISEDNAKETQLMADIAKRTYSDSRTVRIATIIALIYLPANLVTSFFSTVFVSMKMPDGVESSGLAGSAQFTVYSQIWVAVVAMFVLILGTGGWFLFWDRRMQAGLRSSIY